MNRQIGENVLMKTKLTIKENKMLEGVKDVLIAFSCGPDSVCLLDVLNNLYRKRIKLSLCYINHGLRPEKILKDEENLTREFARKYNIAYKILKIQISKKNTGLEASAREKRYSALIKYMHEISAQRIALGHTLNDFLETFFLNLIRGSGRRGLWSIPKVRLPFIRPLIEVKKNEILEYLKVKNIPYCIDQTNKELKYRRNLLRHKIIPQLVKINPKIYETVKNEIEILRQEDEFIEEYTKKVYKRLVKKNRHYLTLDLKKLLLYNNAIITRLVIKVIKELNANLQGFGSKHFKMIIGLKDRESGREVHLPKGIYARREYNNILIGKLKTTDSPFHLAIGVGKEVVIKKYNLSLKTEIVSKFDLSQLNNNTEVFDYHKISPPLIIRTKKEGDYIETKIGKKRLKKIYNEYKIPIHKRGEVLMLCDKRGILWIIGIARATRAFIDELSRKILVVQFEYID